MRIYLIQFNLNNDWFFVNEGSDDCDTFKFDIN